MGFNYEPVGLTQPCWRRATVRIHYSYQLRAMVSASIDPI